MSDYDANKLESKITAEEINSIQNIEDLREIALAQRKQNSVLLNWVAGLRGTTALTILGGIIGFFALNIKYRAVEHPDYNLLKQNTANVQKILDNYRPGVRQVILSADDFNELWYLNAPNYNFLHEVPTDSAKLRSLEFAQEVARANSDFNRFDSLFFEVQNLKAKMSHRTQSNQQAKLKQ